MNLFATSACPELSARALDDARVVSQLRETGQLLSTAVHIAAPQALPPERLYRHSHEAHPVALWVRRSSEAFSWTLQHGLALHSEYCHRFPDAPKGNFGRCAEVLHSVLAVHLHSVLVHLPSCPTETMVNHAANLGMGLDFRSTEDPFQAYRQYLAARWQLARGSRAAPRFTRREPARWARPYL